MLKTRNVWHGRKMKVGEIVKINGKEYKVLAQGEKRNSANFSAVYYTNLIKVGEK